MELCKQMSYWSPCSGEESMASKDEESSSSSLMRNLNMGDCSMMQEEECSMCGDVGLPEYLFKCVICSHRYQHIYCSQFYPYTMETTICNWCLPAEQLLDNIAQIDDSKENMKVCNSNTYTNRNRKPDILEANSNSLLHPQKHTKAFEYLLQVAELHGQGHQLEQCAASEADDHIIGQFSEENCVGHDQSNGICNSYEGGHDQMHAKELINQEPASLLMHQTILGGCRNGSSYTRRGDTIDCLRGPSATSAQLWCTDGQFHAYVGHGQTGKNLVNQDAQLITKMANNDDLRHDQLVQKPYNQDLTLNQTIKKVNHHTQSCYVQAPSISSIKDQQAGCNDGNDRSLKWPDSSAAALKRARLHKLHTVAAGGDHRNIAVDRQKIPTQATNHNTCSTDESEDQQDLVGKTCFSWQGAGDTTAPAKRPRHRHAMQIVTGANEAITPAARQRAMAGNHDLGYTAAASDQLRVMGTKQSPPMQHSWSRPAGKRDHLMNSPGRSINRRYKLLADVLC